MRKLDPKAWNETTTVPMPRLRSLVLPALLLALAVVPACTCTGGAGTGTASSSASASAAPPAASSGSPDEEVRPVYPALTAPPEPLAVRICGLVHSTAELRADACCRRKRGKSGLEKECERAVSGALSLKRVTVAEDKVVACEKALELTFAACDWVRPFGEPSIPPECTSLFEGVLPASARCRSHLECASGLFCEGLSPTQAGSCSAPRLDGGCFGGTDSLATLARQKLGDKHAACDGICVARRCAEPVALGAACKASAECGKDAHCEGTCKKGPPNDCSACPYGTGCVEGSCRAHKKDGEACGTDNECRGQCVKAKGAKTGACAMQCEYVLPGTK